MKLKIKKLHEDVLTPEYATDGSGCFDLRYFEPDMNVHEVELFCGDTAEFTTGLQFEIPKGHVMMIYSRSGHGFKHDVRLANCVGVIDSDYRGEVKVKLTKDFTYGEEPFIVKPDDRIAQAMIIPVKKIEFEEVSNLSNTKRGGKGFGSTGVK